MKKKNNLLVLVDNLEKFKALKELGIISFLFPLHEFSIGYDSFKLEDLKENDNNYLLINRILDCNDIDKLEIILQNIPKNIKGIVFEDIGVYEIAKDMNLELIWFQNHYGTNSEIINFWLDKVNSCVLSYDLTKEKLENICNNVKSPVVVKIFGYNQIMYSKRTLLTNYQDNFNLSKSSYENLTEINSKQEFIIKENEYGTVILNKKIFDGRVLLSLPNIKYFLVDTGNVETNKIFEFIENLEDINHSLGEEFDFSMLYTDTIYKLEGRRC